MNRRQFLIAGALAAGCSSPPAPLPPLEPVPELSDEDRARIASEAEVRRKHLAALEAYRVSRVEERSTPPAAVEIVAAIPELKSQIRQSIRLHPRFGEEPAPDATKLGGQFLWPADTAWPTDPATHIPLVPVLQLREGDRTPQIVYQGGSDLLQLFWLPRDPVGGEMLARIVWRNRTESLNRKLIDNVYAETAFPSLVPVPCRVMPEWVRELPDWERLRVTDLRPKLDAWKVPDGITLDAKAYYNRFLANAHGTKLGGWPRAGLAAPTCKQCRHEMNYYLTIDTSEWSPANAARWRPTQEPDDSVFRRAACGLSVAGGVAVEVSVCRRCPDWPVRAMVVA